MTDNCKLAFVDEYGDANLDTDLDGVSTHFIVSAVIVDQSRLNDARKLAEQVRDKYAAGGELKSKNISKDDDKRLNILQAFESIPVHFYSIVIDKRAIDKNSGLIYKQPFLKFLNGQLHDKLFKTYPNLKVVSDRHGHPEFMDGFKKYVDRKHIPDLFLHAEFDFADSRAEVFIQMADIVAGTLARVYDVKKLSDSGQSFIKTMDAQTLGIEEWPPKYGFRMKSASDKEEATVCDATIRETAVNLAAHFVCENPVSNDEAVQLQVETLKYLLYMFQFVNPSHYVATKRLLEIMSDYKKTPITEHYFRTNVIAPLRDASILLASAPNGYKLPEGAADLLRTVNQFDNIIGPMISRLAKLRNQVKMATTNQVDILEGPEYEKLRHMVSCATQHPLER